MFVPTEFYSHELMYGMSTVNDYSQSEADISLSVLTEKFWLITDTQILANTLLPRSTTQYDAIAAQRTATMIRFILVALSPNRLIR